MSKNAKRGFTLIEILVVMGIIAILAAVVLIAINPARQFSQANNSQRTSNVNAILNAIGQYIADNKGAIPSAITSTSTEISSSGINLCDILVTSYLPALPVDPKVGSPIAKSGCASYSTGYFIFKDANNRITVSAPQTEISSTTISVTR